MKAGGPLLAASLTACAPDAPERIDGSSSEAFAESAERARRDLPNDRRLAFDAALKNPPGRRSATSPAEVERLARQTYDDMTAAEVVESAR